MNQKWQSLLTTQMHKQQNDDKGKAKGKTSSLDIAPLTILKSGTLQPVMLIAVHHRPVPSTTVHHRAVMVK